MQNLLTDTLYRRSNGQPVQIRSDKRIGSGGEGAVYGLDNHPDLVAKVFHTPHQAIGAKLASMMGNPPEMPSGGGHVSIAWPLDTLHRGLPASTGNTVGYLMRRISSMEPVNQCFSPLARRRKFPHFTYKHLCAVAINIAIAMNALHDRNYVIGDLNESNILVDENGLVTLIDTDSFQVIDQNDGTVYKCPVGTPMFTPPELQGHRFDEVVRDQVHDQFGLGVIIYQLLMEGSHPFAGVYTGEGEPPFIEDNISLGYFQHCESRSVPLIEGPGYIRWETLDPSIRNPFRLCFDSGHLNPITRPTAFQWEEAITRVAGSESLATCDQNPQHLYFRHNRSCPWCERATLLRGRDPFPNSQGPEPFLMRRSTTQRSPAVERRAPPRPETQAETTRRQPIAPQPLEATSVDRPSILKRMRWRLVALSTGVFAALVAASALSAGIIMGLWVLPWEVEPADVPVVVGPSASVSSGLQHSCRVKGDLTVVCWGDNDYGQAMPPLGAFTLVSAGQSHSCGVGSDGIVQCWGSHSYGQSSPPNGAFTTVSAGLTHSCGVKTDGVVECWGGNDGGKSTSPSGTYTSVSAGWYHSCGLNKHGAIVCWGVNAYGQANPPEGAFTSVSAGQRHSCGVRAVGSIECWGSNDNGQASPPGGSFLSVSAGALHSCGIRTDQTIECWGNDHYGQARPPRGAFLSVSAGWSHSCGAREDGTVQCWGSNERGQSAPSLPQSTAYVPSAGRPGADHSVYSWVESGYPGGEVMGQGYLSESVVTADPV